MHESTDKALFFLFLHKCINFGIKLTMPSCQPWEQWLESNLFVTLPSPLSGRALARAALGQEFPISTLSIVERVPSPAIAHVSSRPP